MHHRALEKKQLEQMMYAGFDVGGTNVRVALFDAMWRPHTVEKASVRAHTSPNALAMLMAQMLHEMLAAHSFSPAVLSGVGVGIAAQLSSDGRTVCNAPNLGWRDLHFADILEEHVQTPTLLVNDLNAILYGEHQPSGAVYGCKNVLAIYVGTGVGGAILIDGQLAHGAGGYAGEIGHSKVVSQGRLCGCGERGCVEAYAGGIHLEAQVLEASKTYGIDGLVDEDARILLDVADAYATTHPAIDVIWTQATDYLALIAANACTLLNPNALLLGGGVLQHCPNFRQLLEKKLDALTLKVARADLTICTPKLYDHAGMLGAAKLASRITSL